MAPKTAFRVSIIGAATPLIVSLSSHAFPWAHRLSSGVEFVVANGWVGLQFSIGRQIEPVHPFVFEIHDQIFEDTVPGVFDAFGVQIDSPAAVGDFRDQFRRTFEVFVVGESRLPAEFWKDEH